ncbi:MAG: NAD-dependent epimerase/dehydratase family protein [Dehalococcoidia bacterium]|nr:NAD-dependent epimerase/dehydratase family protein [Dehalococcoidia bacterium]
MRLLLTGNRGYVGRSIETQLRQAGHQVSGFDIRDRLDIQKPRHLEKAMRSIEAVVHLAAQTNRDKPATEILTANVNGTWNVLAAAAPAGVQRFVYLSSVNALGIFLGEANPDYLPIDDAHPSRPRNAYGVSKLLAEEVCRHFTTTTGMTTVCLRSASVWLPQNYERALERWRQDPGREWHASWEYGSFIDVSDLASAVQTALEPDVTGHHRLLVCAPDISADGRSSREIARCRYPDVEWRGGSEYDAEPSRALIDTSGARETLGWTPRHTWQAWLAEHGKGWPATLTR